MSNIDGSQEYDTEINEIYNKLKLKASIPGTYCEFIINSRSICYNEQNIKDKIFRYFLPEGEDPKKIRELFIKKLELRDEKYTFGYNDESYNLLINVLYERGWFETIKKELDKIKLYLHMKNITLDPHIFNDQSKLSRYF